MLMGEPLGLSAAQVFIFLRGDGRPGKMWLQESSSPLGNSMSFGEPGGRHSESQRLTAPTPVSMFPISTSLLVTTAPVPFANNFGQHL